MNNGEMKFVLGKMDGEDWLFYNNGGWIPEVEQAEEFEKDDALTLCEELNADGIEVAVLSTRIFKLLPKE